MAIPPPPSFRSWLARAVVIAAALAAVVAGFAEWKLSRLVVGGLGDVVSTKIYSAPLVVGEGERVAADRVLERLRRLGYRTTVSSEPAAGEYSWNPPRLDLHLRGFLSPRFRQPEM